MKRAASLVSLGIITHSGIISYRNYDRHERFAKLGSVPFAADDQLSDNLQTGDILVMRRKWHLQYMPVALNVLLYRYLFGTEFDHVGVILTDKNGKAYVIERSALWGHKITPFHQRITYSKAELMALLPLSPREANLKAESVLRKQGSQDFSSEMIVYPDCFIRYGLYRLSSAVGLRQSHFECPNIDFVKAVFGELNARMLPTNHDEVSSIESLVKKKVEFIGLPDGKRIVLSEDDDVMIRTK